MLNNKVLDDRVSNGSLLHYLLNKLLDRNMPQRDQNGQYVNFPLEDEMPTFRFSSSLGAHLEPSASELSVQP